jgi:metal-responsive CopG/Arc/MetJ family transcriptional regulator
MKTRISITLSTDVWNEIDRLTAGNGSRSAFIEMVLSEHFRRLELPATTGREVVEIEAAAVRLSQKLENAGDSPL